MNKQLINKYKPEFDHWLNEGKILYNIHNSNAWWDNEPWDYSPDYVAAIIINDEYVEFRKALAEGKTVQHNLANLGTWIDITTDNFIDPLTFNDSTPCYRIKPDEHKFKIGDFVRYIPSTPARALEINNINENRYYFTDSDMVCVEHELEPWSPIKGEWCWFYDSKSSKSSYLAEFKQMSEQFFDSEEIGIYDYCEPFLNSRPSYIKDK